MPGPTFGLVGGRFSCKLETFCRGWDPPLCAAMEEPTLDVTPRQSYVADTGFPVRHTGVLVAS